MKERATERLDRAAARGLKSLFPDNLLRVTVGTATCGIISGAREVLDAARAWSEKNPGATVVGTGCIGLCQEEPVLSIMRPGGPVMFYGRVDPAAVEDIIEASRRGEVPGDEALAGATHVLGKLKKEDYRIGGRGWNMNEDRLSAAPVSARPLPCQPPCLEHV